MSKVAKQSHNLSVGIVGLPNSGKSTLFNALTKNSAPAENYPFCTIDKNVGVVKVNDPRLDKLAKFFDAQKVVHSAVTVVDIAGLVKGASTGEGLGNQFLSHIREVDVILFVLRAFVGSDVVHVYDRVDPYEDFQIVMSELILRDVDSVEKRLGNLRKKTRVGPSKDEIFELETLEKVLEGLNKGIAVVDLGLSADEMDAIYDLFLLSAKPYAFILNTKVGAGTEVVDGFVSKLPDQYKDFVLSIDIKTLYEVMHASSDELVEYEMLLGDEMPNPDDVVDLIFRRLDLITFYTGSPKECNAWSIVRGSDVRSASGVIHTDLMKGFITADVVNVLDMIEVGGFANAREKGLVKNVGKDYIVEDGDYILINANTG